MFCKRCISRMRHLNGLASQIRPDLVNVTGVSASVDRQLHSVLPNNKIIQSFTWHTVQADFDRKLSISQRMHVNSGNEENKPLMDPIENLQKFVAVPILSEKERVFRPSQEEILQGQKLFIPTRGHKISFLKSAIYDKQLPQYDLPEVAFIGRSNVGKSSLIRMLLAAADDEVRVRCSKTPGHTKLMNFFQVGEKLTLVDMPGYGFNMPKHYTDSVENFLNTRPKLARVIFIIDGSIGLTSEDILGLNMIEEFKIPYVKTFLLIDGQIGLAGTDKQALKKIMETNTNLCLLLTKIDKTKPSTLLKNVMTVKQYLKQLPHCTPQIFLVSSMTGDGVALLQSFIAYVTGNLAVQNVGLAS